MISVIIPVYNDPQGLTDTLESLVVQEINQEYEIIVVDNNSDEETSKVIETFEQDYPELVKGFEENKVQSSYAARNKGIENAEGDIFCFLDADMWVNEDYLNKIDSYFRKNPGVDYLGCQVEIVDKSGTMAAKFDRFTGFPVQKYLEEKNFVPTCCLSVRSQIFEEIGNFDQNLISGGDKEFGRRAADSNKNMRYLNSVKIYHPARGSVSSIAKKYFRIGRGLHQLESRYKDRFSGEGMESSYLRYYILGDYVVKSPEMQEVMEGIESQSIVNKFRLVFCSIAYRLSIFGGYQYQKNVKSLSLN